MITSKRTGEGKYECATKWEAATRVEVGQEELTRLVNLRRKRSKFSQTGHSENNASTKMESNGERWTMTMNKEEDDYCSDYIDGHCIDIFTITLSLDLFVASRMSPAAEQKVKKLARLPSNSVCANCGTSKKFGFSTVCIKFHTFVCNNCKSSHQAISHRCKSLTMSSWTDAEVAELELKGNDYARRTWLQKAPPIGTGGRPKEGDHVDVFKRFVVDAYERKRYYGEDSGSSAAPASSQLQVATAVPISQPPPAAARRLAQRAMPPVVAPAPPQPAVAAAPAADLLDFSGPAPAPAPASFQANFDAFG